MTLSESLIAELKQEAHTTRRVLERVPENNLAWKPHPKSLSLGQLAIHIARLPRAIADLLSESVREVPTVPLPEGKTTAETLAMLEDSVAYATATLGRWGDAELEAPWTMTREGKTLFQVRRIDMIRSIMLNHWYHHRGQLTVYLRILDIPLPSVYGASADETPFA